jgi:hypothetical protein
MRLPVFLAVALLLWAMSPARAEDNAVSSGDRAAIHDVITQQMAAFARDDGNAAFAFASPGIQQQFASSDNFMSMVRRAYPAVYRPRSVSFGAARRVDGSTIQEVDLIGPDGNGARALYIMERESDGTWRINGVELAASAEKEA